MNGRAPTTATAAGGQDIDIWLAWYDKFADDRQLAGLRRLLSPEETSRESRFHFADDRRRYLELSGKSSAARAAK